MLPSGWSMKNGQWQLRTRTHVFDSIPGSIQYRVETVQSTMEGLQMMVLSQNFSQSYERHPPQGDSSCLVWPRSFSLIYRCIYLDLEADQCAPLWLHLFCFHVTSWGIQPGNPSLAGLKLYHLVIITIVFPKNTLLSMFALKKTNRVEFTLFTHPDFCILFGVILVTQNTDWTFFNLCWYSVNMSSWWAR